MTTTNTREIKFRAWDKKRNIMCELTTNIFSGVKTLMFNDAIKELQEDHIILMQYTGLKDKNRKEIYEGDLLLTDDMHHDYEDGVAINALPDGKIYPVESRDGAFFAGDELLYEVATTWEIIGNIYENSDLLV